MNASVRDRKYAVERVKHLLQRHSSPRLQMSMMLFATALAGFFCSFLLLQLGMKSMAMRYTLAVVLAYAVFLSILRLWLHRRQRKAEDHSGSNALDLLNIDLPTASAEGVKAVGSVGFGGGSSGGGGASRSFAPGSGDALDNFGAGAASDLPFDNVVAGIDCCRSLRGRRLFYSATFARSEFDRRSLSLNFFKTRRVLLERIAKPNIMEGENHAKALSSKHSNFTGMDFFMRHAGTMRACKFAGKRQLLAAIRALPNEREP